MNPKENHSELNLCLSFFLLNIKRVTKRKKITKKKGKTKTKNVQKVVLFFLGVNRRIRIDLDRPDRQVRRRHRRNLDLCSLSSMFDKSKEKNTRPKEFFEKKN